MTMPPPMVAFQPPAFCEHATLAPTLFEQVIVGQQPVVQQVKTAQHILAHGGSQEAAANLLKGIPALTPADYHTPDVPQFYWDGLKQRLAIYLQWADQSHDHRREEALHMATDVVVRDMYSFHDELARAHGGAAQTLTSDLPQVSMHLFMRLVEDFHRYADAQGVGRVLLEHFSDSGEAGVLREHYSQLLATESPSHARRWWAGVREFLCQSRMATGAQAFWTSAAGAIGGLVATDVFAGNVGTPGFMAGAGLGALLCYGTRLFARGAQAPATAQALETGFSRAHLATQLPRVAALLGFVYAFFGGPVPFVEFVNSVPGLNQLIISDPVAGTQFHGLGSALGYLNDCIVSNGEFLYRAISDHGLEDGVKAWLGHVADTPFGKMAASTWDVYSAIPGNIYAQIAEQVGGEATILSRAMQVMMGVVALHLVTTLVKPGTREPFLSALGPLVYYALLFVPHRVALKIIDQLPQEVKDRIYPPEGADASHRARAYKLLETLVPQTTDRAVSGAKRVAEWALAGPLLLLAESVAQFFGRTGGTMRVSGVAMAQRVAAMLGQGTPLKTAPAYPVLMAGIVPILLYSLGGSAFADVLKQITSMGDAYQASLGLVVLYFPVVMFMVLCYKLNPKQWVKWLFRWTTADAILLNMPRIMDPLGMGKFDAEVYCYYHLLMETAMNGWWDRVFNSGVDAAPQRAAFAGLLDPASEPMQAVQHSSEEFRFVSEAYRRALADELGPREGRRDITEAQLEEVMGRVRERVAGEFRTRFGHDLQQDPDAAARTRDVLTMTRQVGRRWSAFLPLTHRGIQARIPMIAAFRVAFLKHDDPFHAETEPKFYEMIHKMILNPAKYGFTVEHLKGYLASVEEGVASCREFNLFDGYHNVLATLRAAAADKRTPADMKAAIDEFFARNSTLTAMFNVGDVPPMPDGWGARRRWQRANFRTTDQAGERDVTTPEKPSLIRRIVNRISAAFRSG
jgi:hypothetical protein